MMDAKLAALIGMAIPWLLWALMRWRAEPLPPAAQDARIFHLSDEMRWSGVFLALAAPGLLLPPMFFIPAEDIKPDDWLFILPLAMFMGGLSVIAGLELWRGAFRTDSAGLVGTSSWGSPQYLAWQDVRAIAFSAGSQALRFEGNGKRVYVPTLLDDWPGFLAQLRRHLPHLELSVEVHADGERLAFEGHFQGMYDNAQRIFAVAAAVFVLTLPFLAPYLPALALSAAGGAGLALFPLVRRLMPKPRRFSSTIGNVIQFAGLAAFVFFTNLGSDVFATHLGGDEQIAAGIHWALLGQNLSTSVIALALLLLFARWRWPEHFAHKRMGQPEA